MIHNLHIENRIRAFDSYRSRSVTLNVAILRYLNKLVDLGTNYVTVVEVRSTLSEIKI